MVGDGRKKKRKQRRRGQPATIVVDLRLDLRGLAALAGSAPDSVARPGDVLAAPLTPPIPPSPKTSSPLGSDGGPTEDASGSETAACGPAWPLGPHYLRWVEGKGVAAWARFKLRSADWYLEALEVAEREVGLDRFVGVEMAIDGVLSSLCAGVEAAAHALRSETEHLAGPSAPRPPWAVEGGWTLLVELAEGTGTALGSARALERAVRGDHDETEGWLAELYRLRALAVQRNVLVRRPNVDGAARSRLLDVPGLGQRPVVRYLRKARRRAESLVEVLLAEVDALAHERPRPLTRPASLRGGLPDLSARAGLCAPRRKGPEAR